MFNTNLAYLHMIDIYMLESLAALIIASCSSCHSYVYNMCCIWWGNRSFTDHWEHLERSGLLCLESRGHPYMNTAYRQHLTYHGIR